jgi:putative acetyltransferase
VDVRAERADESAAVGRVIDAAFGDGRDVAGLWADVVARGLDRASLVAVHGDEVVGHVGLSHGWLDARRELVDVLILSPLSVLPQRQGQGVGTSLLVAAIKAADAAGAPALFLEGSPAYYGPRGFEAASGHGFEAPSLRTPRPAFQVALLSAYVPWMTGRIVYREVWWEHDAAGLRDPRLAEVERMLGVEPEVSATQSVRRISR